MTGLEKKNHIVMFRLRMCLILNCIDMESSSNFDLAGISMLIAIMAGVLALRLGINLRDA